MDVIGNNLSLKIILLIPNFGVSRTNEKEKRTFSAHSTLRIFPGFFFFSTQEIGLCHIKAFVMLSSHCSMCIFLVRPPKLWGCLTPQAVPSGYAKFQNHNAHSCPTSLQMRALVGESQICDMLHVLAVLFLSNQVCSKHRQHWYPNTLCFMRLLELRIPLAVLLVPDSRIICVLCKVDAIQYKIN